MKRYVFILLVVFLFLSSTTLTYAEPDVEIGGRLLIRGWYLDNVSDYTVGLPQEVNSDSFYTTNAYIYIDGKVSDNVQGYMEIETQGSTAAGTLGTRQSGLYVWGVGGNLDQKPNQTLNFRQAWILYKGSGLLGVPAGIKVGHQLLTLGEKQFLNLERFGTDAVVVFVEPTKELFLAALTAKINEGSIQLSGDDLDCISVLGTYKVNKDNTVGINYTLLESDDIDQVIGIVGPALDGLTLQNVGLHANGMVAGITYAAEVDMQFGKLKAQPEGVLPDSKYRGWAVYAKGGYKLEPVNIRAAFAMGSGEKDLNDQKNKEFQVIMPADTESTVARFTHYTQIYERTIATAALAQTVAGPNRNTGIANTTYYNLGFDVLPTKELSLSLDGYIIRATTTDGWRDTVLRDVSKNVGWELDGKGSYKLAKNLTYFVEAGVFRPGAFYEDAFGIDKETVTQVIHGLNLTF